MGIAGAITVALGAIWVAFSTGLAHLGRPARPRRRRRRASRG